MSAHRNTSFCISFASARYPAVCVVLAFARNTFLLLARVCSNADHPCTQERLARSLLISMVSVDVCACAVTTDAAHNRSNSAIFHATGHLLCKRRQKVAASFD